MRTCLKHARALLELARAQRAAGMDAAHTLKRSRAILDAWGTGPYLPQVDALVAAD